MNFGSKEEEMAMKQYIISLLVRQAQADGHFTNIEKKYLAYVSQALKLTDADVAMIRSNPDAFDITPPPDESMRMTVLYYLLFMMKADNRVEREEEVLCYEVGFRLGFREEMIAELIALMKQFLRDDIPSEGMLDRVKPFLN